uniref:CCHC-type domain-containing protein n=1 Tax=Podarcis muralis TaxID=64176 RepID=A0A670JY50_PODMU
MAWDSESESDPEESQPAQESPPPGPAELGQGLDAEETQEQAPGEIIQAPEVLEDSVATGEPPPGPSDPSASPDLQRLRAMADQAATLLAIAQENQALRHTVQQLSNVVTALQQRLDALPAPGADAPASGKYPVALPEKFDGAPASFPMFLAQAKLYIKGRAQNFPDDRTKVHFLISLLKDQAAKWALPLLRQDSPFQANRAIRRLRQGKSTVAAYTTEFRLLAQDLTWNDSALRDQYLEGLSDEILDQLATMERPTTLDTLIQQSLQIDDRLEDRRQARGRWHLQFSAPVSTSSPTGPAESLEEPMQLGAVRPRLSPAEKSRRREGNLCLYCGRSGHYARSCPEKRQPQGNRQTPVADGPGYLGSQTAQNGAAPIELQHLMVPVHLYPPGGPWILTHALVDSGATRSYMDAAFAATSEQARTGTGGGNRRTAPAFGCRHSGDPAPGPVPPAAP